MTVSREWQTFVEVTFNRKLYNSQNTTAAERENLFPGIHKKVQEGFSH